MSQNGIVAIVKLTDLVDLDANGLEVNLSSGNSLFELKKFMPKFYMIKLKASSKELHSLSDSNGMINLDLSAFYDSKAASNCLKPNYW
jgi:hypothetical protein